MWRTGRGKLWKAILLTEQSDLSNSHAGMCCYPFHIFSKPSTPLIIYMPAPGATITKGITSRSQKELALIMVLHSPVIFSYTPVLPPCFWKAKLQLTSVLAHIPRKWSQGPALPSCGLCFSGFSKYDGWKSSWVVVGFGFFSRLLVAKSSPFPCQGNRFPLLGTSLLTLGLMWFQK